MVTKKIVLLVDDDSSIRKTISGLLHQWGYGVVEAKDGMEAYTLLEGNNAESIQFYAVITDMQMPRTSGLGLCQMLHRRGIVLPVLVHSSDIGYNREDVDIKNLEELKEWFPFVKMTRKKPSLTGYMGYLKSFLDSPELCPL